MLEYPNFYQCRTRTTNPETQEGTVLWKSSVCQSLVHWRYSIRKFFVVTASPLHKAEIWKLICGRKIKSSIDNIDRGLGLGMGLAWEFGLRLVNISFIGIHYTVSVAVVWWIEWTGTDWQNSSPCIDICSSLINTLWRTYQVSLSSDCLTLTLIHGQGCICANYWFRV